MKMTKGNVITITEWVNGSEGATEYFNKISKVNAFINLLVCAGYNEDENACDWRQAWTGKNGEDELEYVFEQQIANTRYGFSF